MGRYYVVVYTGASGVVEEIERHFKILPEVIRFISVAVEADYDYDKQIKAIQQAEEISSAAAKCASAKAVMDLAAVVATVVVLVADVMVGLVEAAKGGFGGGREGGGFRGEKGGSERGA
jgi:chaperone required for assembly of F1-ATPase